MLFRSAVSHFISKTGALHGYDSRGRDGRDALRAHGKINLVATSNSWGGGGFSQALQDAIGRALFGCEPLVAGTLVVSGRERTLRSYVLGHYKAARSELVTLHIPLVQYLARRFRDRGHEQVARLLGFAGGGDSSGSLISITRSMASSGMDSACGSAGIWRLTNAARLCALRQTSGPMSHAMPNEHLPALSACDTCSTTRSNSMPAIRSAIAE